MLLDQLNQNDWELNDLVDMDVDVIDNTSSENRIEAAG